MYICHLICAAANNAQYLEDRVWPALLVALEKLQIAIKYYIPKVALSFMFPKFIQVTCIHRTCGPSMKIRPCAASLPQFVIRTHIVVTRHRLCSKMLLDSTQSSGWQTTSNSEPFSMLYVSVNKLHGQLQPQCASHVFSRSGCGVSANAGPRVPGLSRLFVELHNT